MISTPRGVVTENSSDLDSGRRPELESDEFSVTTPLVVEILGSEFDTFSKKVNTYWDFGSQPYPFQPKQYSPRLFQHFGPKSLPPDPDSSQMLCGA